MEMREVQSVSLSPGIYLQEKWTVAILLPSLLPVGGYQKGEKVKKGPYFGHSPATTTPLPCPLPALEHAASKNNKDGREEMMWRYMGSGTSQNVLGCSAVSFS